MKVLVQFTYNYKDPIGGHVVQGHDAVVLDAMHSRDIPRLFSAKLMELLAFNVAENRFPGYPEDFEIVSYRPETFGPDCAAHW